MKEVLINKCTIQNLTRWYEIRLNEIFPVIEEDGEYLVVYDKKYNFNRRILKIDGEFVS